MAQRTELMKQDCIRLQRARCGLEEFTQLCGGTKQKHYVNAVMHAMQGYRIRPSPSPSHSVPLTPAGESLIVVRNKKEEKLKERHYR
jgi:hypothetical protein